MASFLSADATPFVPSAKPGGRKKPNKKVGGGGNSKRNGKTGGKMGQQQRSRGRKKLTDQSPESAFATSSLGEKGRISEVFLGFRYEKDDTDRYMQSQYVPKKKSKRPVEKFDRALFLISTFRFALHPSAFSSPTFSRVEPERKLDWNTVEEVVVDVKDLETSINCPICLCPSAMATISKCGHIYCRICILRHLNTDVATRHGHAQCPICYDQIFENDLRFARKRVVNPLNVGEQIELSLMYRQRDQVRPQLAYTPLVPKHNIFPTPAMSSSTFAKFLKCDKVWARSIIVRQLNELKMVVSEMLSDVGLLEALGHVEDAERERTEIDRLVSLTRKSLAEKALNWNLEDMLDDIAFEVEASAPPSAAVAPIFENEDFPSLGSVSNDTKPKSAPKPPARWGKQAHGERTLKEKDLPATAMDNGCADDKAAWVENIAGSVADGFYFYQVPTGQNAFLHPFTVSMLKEEFGTYDKFPSTIRGPLLDVETVTLNREKMKFYKYLMHLNMNAECDFLDLDISSYLSERTRKKFKFDIQKRHRALKKKKMSGKGKDFASNGAAMFSQDCPLPDFERITSIEEERMKSVDIKNFPAVGTPPSVSTQKSPEIIPEERSFARITTNMGFFPTLGEAVSMKQPTKGASRSLKGAMRKKTNPWGQ